MNLLLSRWSTRTVAVAAGAFLLVGYLQQSFAPGFWLPWALETLPATVPMFYVGYILRRQDLGRLLPWALVLSAGAVILIHCGYNVAYDLKFANFGISGITFVAMVACMIVLLWAAPWIGRVRWLAAPLHALGAASLTIMYLHYPTFLIQEKHFGWIPPSLSLVIAVALPLCLHYVLQASGVTRAILLGSKSDLLRLTQWRRVAAT